MHLALERPAEPGVSLMIARPILAAITSLGGDVAGFKRRMGIDENASWDERVPASRLAVALEEASRHLGEPDLGLRMAQVLPAGAFGFFDYCALSSATLREGLTQAVRFYGLLTDRLVLSLREERDVVRLVHALRPGMRRVPHLVELALAVMAARCQLAAGERMFLCEVWLARPPSQRPELYERHFGAPVRWNAPVDQIVFDRGLLDLPFRTADAVVARALVTQGNARRAELAPVAPFLDDVRGVVRRALEQGSESVGSTAIALGMSARSLQRRLAETGTSYTGVVDGVRRELALQLVGGRPASEVAFLLGFSRPAAFFRAFRRWTGTTPGAYAVSARVA
jgi:AraC-like DNA-binding protein